MSKGARADEDGMVDEVWQQAFIPKRLDEVDTFERDQRRLRSGGGETEGVYYQSITGMKKDLPASKPRPRSYARSRTPRDWGGRAWPPPPAPRQAQGG